MGFRFAIEMLDQVFCSFMPSVEVGDALYFGYVYYFI